VVSALLLRVQDEVHHHLSVEQTHAAYAWAV